MEILRVSLLHLALQPGDLDHNLALVQRGIAIAAEKGAHWVVTPELAISGYQFPDLIGTDWIAAHPDNRTREVCAAARTGKVVVFLGHPARGDDNKLYNCVSVIDADGSIIGHHRKTNVIPEPWATPGKGIEPVAWNGLRIGMLICADAYTRNVAHTLRDAAVEILVSPCAWGPGQYGPAGEWEQRSAETGLPLFVCNRTGRETSLSFLKAESLVIKNGMRLLTHSSPDSAVLTFDWDLKNSSLRSTAFEVASVG